MINGTAIPTQATSFFSYELLREKKKNQPLPSEFDGAVQIMVLITVSCLVSVYVLSMLPGSSLCTLRCHHFCGHRSDTSKLYLMHITAELAKIQFLMQ